MEARKKRRKHNRLGWSVQWGTVRMLGTFLEDPIEIPWVSPSPPTRADADSPGRHH
ncbi:DUF4158 domain-containing protein [Nonomuraea solani]|uniref:DUF4158 domain-containing protein n=1 Tax=Nonomuraea solani TaxID=1144553 RepID=UPI00135846FF